MSGTHAGRIAPFGRLARGFDVLFLPAMAEATGSTKIPGPAWLPLRAAGSGPYRTALALLILKDRPKAG